MKRNFLKEDDFFDERYMYVYEFEILKFLIKFF